MLPAADGYVPAPVPVFRGPGGLLRAGQLRPGRDGGDGVTVPLAFTTDGVFRAQATGWLDVSRTPDDYEVPLKRGAATQYGDAVFAVNGIDPVGILPLGAGDFRDIADAPFGLSANYRGGGRLPGPGIHHGLQGERAATSPGYGGAGAAGRSGSRPT